MMNSRFYSLLFVFALCFGSFLAGWLIAVFILPGNLPPSHAGFPEDASPEARQKAIEAPLKADLEKPKEAFPFFKEMRDNIMLLFDPYKMDSLMKKDIRLNKKDSYIKSPSGVKAPLKLQLSRKKMSTGEKRHSKSLGQKEDKPSFPLGKPWPGGSPSSAPKEESSALQELKAEYDKQNRERLLKIAKAQPFFKMDGKFSFLINVFSDKEEALGYAQKMKDKYPLWNFLIKARKEHIRIYLGPFPSRKKALEFKKNMPSSFSQEFLEEMGL